jgi:hypothetical protein
MDREILDPAPLTKADRHDVEIDRTDADDLRIDVRNQHRGTIAFDCLPQPGDRDSLVPLWRPHARWVEEPFVTTRNGLCLIGERIPNDHVQGGYRQGSPRYPMRSPQSRDAAAHCRSRRPRGARGCVGHRRSRVECQDGGMDVLDHVRLPDGRRLDSHVSGPAAGFPLVFHDGTPGAATSLRAVERAVHAHGLRLVTTSRFARVWTGGLTTTWRSPDRGASTWGRSRCRP